MDEESLNLLSIDELLDHLVITTSDLVAMHRRYESDKAIMDQMKQIQLIQKVIIAKRASEHPLK